MDTFHIFFLYPLNNILPGVYQTRDTVGGSHSLHQRPSSLSAVHPMAAGSRRDKSRKGGTSKINHRPRQAELQYQPGIPSFSPGGGFSAASVSRSARNQSRAPTPTDEGGVCCCCPDRMAQLADKPPRTKAGVELLPSPAQLCFR